MPFAEARASLDFSEPSILKSHNAMPMKTHFWGEKLVRIKLSNIEDFVEDVRNIMNRATVILITFAVCCSCKNSAWTS